MSAKESPTALINRFIGSLKESAPDAAVAVILIGSVARNMATANSDLDLLVVSEHKIELRRTADRIHVQTMTEAEFLERLSKGDDFAAWCVRFGIPVVHSELWNRIVNTKEAETWPDWRQKIQHAARRLLLAAQLTKLDDEDAASEELAYAVSHLGRALLLKNRVFPLSRPEMIQQLNEAGYPALSSLLQELTFGPPAANTVRQGMRYVKKLLVHLDREQFEAYVQARRVAKKGKIERSLISPESA